MAPMHHHLAAIFLCCALSVFLPHLVHAGGRRVQTTCAVGISSINIHEEFQSNDGGSLIFCRGTTTVNQCEGECTSRSAPSVVSATGYSKDCNCCREVILRTKEVILTECFDSATGNAIMNQHYPVYVPEPSTCSCQTCSL